MCRSRTLQMSKEQDKRYFTMLTNPSHSDQVSDAQTIHLIFQHAYMFWDPNSKKLDGEWIAIYHCLYLWLTGWLITVAIWCCKSGPKWGVKKLNSKGLYLGTIYTTSTKMIYIGPQIKFQVNWLRIDWDMTFWISNWNEAKKCGIARSHALTKDNNKKNKVKYLHS